MYLEGPLCYLELDSGPSDMPFWSFVIFVTFVVRALCIIIIILWRIEGGRCQDFLFLFSIPCYADHERDWPPRNEVVFRVGNQKVELRATATLLRRSKRVQIFL